MDILEATLRSLDRNKGSEVWVSVSLFPVLRFKGRVLSSALGKGAILVSVWKLSMRRRVLWQSSGKWPRLFVGRMGRPFSWDGSLGLESLVWERVSQRDKITFDTDRRWCIVTYRGFTGHQMKCMKSFLGTQFSFYYQLERYGPKSSPFILYLFFLSKKPVRWWWLPSCSLLLPFARHHN